MNINQNSISDESMDAWKSIRLPLVKHFYPTLLSSQIVGMTPEDIEQMCNIENGIVKEIKYNLDKIKELLYK